MTGLKFHRQLLIYFAENQQYCGFALKKDSQYYYIRIMTGGGVKSLLFETKDVVTPVIDKLYKDLIHIKTE